MDSVKFLEANAQAFASVTAALDAHDQKFKELEALCVRNHNLLVDLLAALETRGA